MFYAGPQEQIREGATIRERQTIITIPDMTRMSVKVKIHESYIKKIRKGQKVRITVDAFPDQLLEGEGTNVRQHADIGDLALERLVGKRVHGDARLLPLPELLK